MQRDPHARRVLSASASAPRVRPEAARACPDVLRAPGVEHELGAASGSRSSTRSSPPIERARWRAANRPIPAPRGESSRRTKGSKMRSRHSAGMPGPVVRDREARPIVLAPAVDVDRALRRRVLGGVLQQVAEQPAEHVAPSRGRAAAARRTSSRSRGGGAMRCQLAWPCPRRPSARSTGTELGREVG